MAISEFIKSVPADSNVVIRRDIQPFPVSKNILKSIVCYSHIRDKKEECLSLNLDSHADDMKNLLQDIKRIMDCISIECIDDLTRITKIFSEAIQPYTEISKMLNTEPKVGIICIGNARTGKSRLLTTSQTDFDPKFAASGSDTAVADQKLYVFPDGYIGLIDTPGLYEVEKEHLERNIKEITKGVKLAKHMKLCLVGRANSGNIRIQDHAVIARISECLSSKSYGIGTKASPEGKPIIATLIINHVSEWEMDEYTKENIETIYKSITSSVTEFGGRICIQQIILIASMDPKVLAKKTDNLIHFINETAETNELEFRTPLKASPDDIPRLKKVLSAAGAGALGLSGGVVAKTFVEKIIVPASRSAPYFSFGVFLTTGIFVYSLATNYLGQTKTDRSSESFSKNDIRIYTLKAKDDFPMPSQYIREA
ncbi:hypothetical protein BGZ58_004773 [Dissophora ornata]|nr:hypothetical protein BGZ58_004773 [Dissophora ornata]